MATGQDVAGRKDFLSRILGPGPEVAADPTYEQAIAEAAVRLTGIAEEMVQISNRIEDTALRGELQRLILDMLSDVRTVSRAVVPIVKRRTRAG